MEKPRPAPASSPFEQFVQKILAVPKTEADAEKAKLDAEPRMKPGPKPKPKSAA